ncbi:orotidine 5'-phosphate decarboxylase / HUMPS family protein [Amycolatopsis saalfeldensis]|uniref:orotidine 5'-phosphate decarboxylase / HUMPS family protein n=1 Tax=Amycolatopsis saalfeldensis TaxID=394193 RepID=UPI000B843FD0|nr:orotidine 5'-phosphate decarboxylase / HUMPS family protein [Amycolatopsis saalfeldensis]
MTVPGGVRCEEGFAERVVIGRDRHPAVGSPLRWEFVKFVRSDRRREERAVTRRPTWTPPEVKLLREVQNLSQRAFAQRLGYAQSTVVGWEKPQRAAPLQHETVEVLDVELGRLEPDRRERFDQERGVVVHRLGAGSAVRTAAILATVDSEPGAPLPYTPPAGVVGSARLFLESSARVFLVPGSAGIGKTSLTRHLAQQFTREADCQLLTVGSWEMSTVDIAAEILRYASIPRGDDALLTLEEHSARLTRPCLVLVDGIASHEAFATVGRQIDAILRQATASALRFLLTVRTPPAIETTAHPLLHASLFTPADERHALSPWPVGEARAHWERAASASFDSLSAGIQHLVRTPLYMKLALAAPPLAGGGDLGAYALVDHCVRRVLGTDGTERYFPLLTELAHRYGHDDLPAALNVLDDGAHPVPELPSDLPATLLRVTQHRQVEFSHDVLREFFLSTRIADLLHRQGRSVAAVQALNELADRASTSGAARSMFALVLERLDLLAPALLEAIATAPTASLRTTVPLMMSMAGAARFLTPEVLRSCAARAEHDNDPALSRALLGNPRLHHALGPGRYRWLLALLRQFGVTLWAEVTSFVEENFDSTDAYTFLDLANLADGAEATFFARHFYLFFADAANSTLEIFLSHTDWRVRAALAEALGDDTVSVDDTGLTVMTRLVHDTDYKVRAAIAPDVGRAPGHAAVTHLTVLLNDDNWHVRERALQGLDRLGLPSRRPDLIQAALDILATEPAWSRTPGHIRPSQDRLRILHAPPRDAAASNEEAAAFAHDPRAIVTILREIRTGHLTPPDYVRDRLIDGGRRSDRWLVRREAEHAAMTDPAEDDDPRRVRERYRRIRNHRSVQIALDLHDVAGAVQIAEAAADAGADFIEVGDPLIKEAGVRAIEQIKSAVEDTPVIAEMMSADWGRDQVVLAAQAGADIVQLIGPATTASVRAAVDAGRRLAVPILLDVPVKASHRWITEMERAGVDGFTVTTNIDVGIGSTTPLDVARELRHWTALPVAVSGGFSTTDSAVLASPDWDILIVGRSVVDALDPATAAKNLVELVHLSERHR